MTFRIVLVVLSVVWMAGCAGLRDTETPPDETFGHRFVDPPDDRAIAFLATDPMDSDVFLYPAHIDSLHIRPGRFEPHLPTELQRVAVEVLVKGVFADECFELAHLDQRRFGHVLEVDLLMRKEQDLVCRRVRRPYRYYFTLDGSFRAGYYTLKMNGRVYPFEIRAES